MPPAPSRAINSAWIPLGSFILAIALSLVAGPGGLHARRAPAAASGPECHEYSQVTTPEECSGVTTYVLNGQTVTLSDDDCTSPLPELVPGGFNESRAARSRNEFGEAEHLLGALAGGVGPGGPLPASPVQVAIHKRLRLRAGGTCKDLPHEMHSAVSVRVRVRLELPAPLLNGDRATALAHARAWSVRFSDMGLNENDFKSLTTHWTLHRRPSGQLEEVNNAAFMASPGNVVRKPLGLVLGQPQLRISSDLLVMAAQRDRFNRNADVIYGARAFAERLVAPRMKPAQDADDERSIRASLRPRVELSEDGIRLGDITEGLGDKERQDQGDN